MDSNVVLVATKGFPSPFFFTTAIFNSDTAHPQTCHESVQSLQDLEEMPAEHVHMHQFQHVNSDMKPFLCHSSRDGYITHPRRQTSTWNWRRTMSIPVSYDLVLVANFEFSSGFSQEELLRESTSPSQQLATGALELLLGTLPLVGSILKIWMYNPYWQPVNHGQLLLIRLCMLFYTIVF